jgi:hypothetical protein
MFRTLIGEGRWAGPNTSSNPAQGAASDRSALSLAFPDRCLKSVTLPWKARSMIVEQGAIAIVCSADPFHELRVNRVLPSDVMQPYMSSASFSSRILSPLESFNLQCLIPDHVHPPISGMKVRHDKQGPRPTSGRTQGYRTQQSRLPDGRQ